MSCGEVSLSSMGVTVTTPSFVGSVQEAGDYRDIKKCRLNLTLLCYNGSASSWNQVTVPKFRVALRQDAVRACAQAPGAPSLRESSADIIAVGQPTGVSDVTPMILSPRPNDAPTDPVLEAEAALEAAFQDLVARAVAAGWKPMVVAQALVSLSIAQTAAAMAEVEADRHIGRTTDTEVN